VAPVLAWEPVNQPHSITLLEITFPSTILSFYLLACINCGGGENLLLLSRLRELACINCGGGENLLLLSRLRELARENLLLLSRLRELASDVEALGRRTIIGALETQDVSRGA